MDGHFSLVVSESPNRVSCRATQEPGVARPRAKMVRVLRDDDSHLIGSDQALGLFIDGLGDANEHRVVSVVVHEAPMIFAFGNGYHHHCGRQDGSIDFEHLDRGPTGVLDDLLDHLLDDLVACDDVADGRCQGEDLGRRASPIL